MKRYCFECHQDPPKGSAPFPLTTREQTVAAAPRMLIRMKAGTMPPVGPRPGARELEAFERWIDAGYPQAGSCSDFDAGFTDAGVTDGGASDGGPSDAGQPTCASNAFYNQATELPGELMNPGLSCPTCHIAAQNFYVAFSYAGTVMAGLHEQDRCKSPAPDGGRVELLELDGGPGLVFAPNSSGNFKTLDAGPNPFVARISLDGASKRSLTPHTSGDCNSCHTEQGANGASGRLTWP